MDRNDSASGTGVSDKAKQAGQVAKEGAQDVAGTAKEQGREVAREARDQARSVASDLRSSVETQAHTQNKRLAGGLRQMADQFHQMGPDDGSPAGQVVRRLGESGKRAADYLEDRGPQGLLEDVQDFARRKPGAFLLAAAVAGFVVGRLGRTVLSGAQGGGSAATPTPDAYPEGNGVYRSATATETVPPAGTTPYVEPVYAEPAYTETSTLAGSGTYTEPATYTEPGTYAEPGTYTEPPVYTEPPSTRPGGSR